MGERIPIAIDQNDAASLLPAERLARLSRDLRALDYASVRRHFEVPHASRLLKTTLSLCPDCLAHVPAAVYAEDGRVLLNKRCDRHGVSRALLENDERYYFLSNKDRWGRRYAPDRVMDIPTFGGSCCGPGESCGDARDEAPWLHDFTDQRSNKTCTVLVEVTDACNLACRVCYADSKGDRLLPLETFRRHMRALIALKGRLDSVQVTGGEASLHPEFWEIVAFLHAEPAVGKIYLPTNGIEFVKPGAAERLVPFRDKLLVLLQFDGIEPATNRALRQANPERVRERLLARLDRLGVPMQLTMTLARGVSEREIAWVVAQGVRHRNVRLVAMQPATYSGRYDLAPDPIDRMTLSDVVKGVVAGLIGRTKESDFLPIPCSHPNCGWVTLFARRFGAFLNIARHVDLNAVMDQVAYKTLLNQREMQDIIGTRKSGLWKRLAAKLGRRLIRPRDVFGIAIKPFMDRFSYDQDRISACCHHMLDTEGALVSFCEYNARLRQRDSWAHLPRLERRAVETNEA
ncbi:MAG TPA: radical SAM protein [Rhodanobacteraceae bacterium]